MPTLQFTKKKQLKELVGNGDLAAAHQLFDSLPKQDFTIIHKIKNIAENIDNPNSSIKLNNG